MAMDFHVMCIDGHRWNMDYNRLSSLAFSGVSMNIDVDLWDVNPGMHCVLGYKASIPKIVYLVNFLFVWPNCDDVL